MGTASFSRAVLTKLIRKQFLKVAQGRRKNQSSSSMKPPSSGFTSWSSCTSLLNFRETPSQSGPSSWPAITTSPTSSSSSHLAGVSFQGYVGLPFAHLKIAGVK
ncbi:hypothetical protein DFAR_350004 [Desulfarculales bacterium]